MSNGIEIPDFMNKGNYLTVKENNERIKRNNELKEAQKKREKRINVTKKSISVALVAIASLTIASAGTYAKEQIIGANQIKKQFNQSISDYGIIDSSTGYVIIKNSEYLEFEEALNEMIECAKDNGMNDTKIYIGMSDIFGSKTTKEFLGEIDSDKIRDEKSRAYHEDKLEELNKKGAR